MAAKIRLASLVVPIVAETAEFTKGLGGAARQATSWAANVAKTVAKVGLTVIAAGATAAAAAIGGIAVGLGKLALEAAPLEGIGMAFEQMAGDVGVSLDALRTAAAGTISDFDLMRQANVALTGAGEEFGQEFGKALPALLEGARAAARATGQDVDFLFESLVSGVKRSSPMLIDNTGIVLKLGEANQALADSLGIAVGDLSAEQKQIALLNATVEAAAGLASEMGLEQLTAAERIAQFKTQIQNATDQIGLAMIPALQALIEPMTELATGIGPQLIEWAQQLGTWLGENIPVAIETLRSLWEEVWPVIQTKVEEVWPILQDIFAQIQTWMTDEGPSALASIQDAFAEVWGFIQEITGTFLDWFGENLPLMESAGENLIIAWEAIKTSFDNIWNIIKEIVQLAIDTVLEIVTLVMAIISGDWETAWQAILDIVAGIWESIQNIVTEFIEGVANVVGTTTEEIKGTWKSVWESIKVITSTVWQNIVEAIKSKVEEIKTWLGNQVAAFKALGENLMFGIRDGIKAKVEEIISAITGAIREAIAAAKSFLGAESPSRVFADIGRGMMLGMAQGITASAHVPAMATIAATSQTITGATTTNNFTQNVFTQAQTSTVVPDFMTLQALNR